MKITIIVRTKSGRFRTIVLAASSLFSFSHDAIAQEAAQDADGPEIIVTALKRDTKLQDTPISISAVTGSAIANSGVQSIADLGAAVPGLSFVDGGPSQRRVVIRGIQSAGEPLVGTYYDETPVTGSIGATNDAGGSTPELRLFDVERVEVLRGPQGTLYGAGSMGGTLRVIYAKPSDLVEGRVDGSLSWTKGGGPNYDASAMVNVPIVEGKIAFRAVGSYRNADGFIDNTRLGIDDINGNKSYGGRFLLRVTPAEHWTIDGAIYVNRNRTDTNSWILEAGKLQTDAYIRQPVRDDLDLYSLTSAYDLGDVKLTAVASYLERDLDTVSDVSPFVRSSRTPQRCALLVNANAPCSAAQLTSFYALVDGQSTAGLFPQQSMDTFTSEVRLGSDGAGGFNWTIGGYYSDRKSHVVNPQANADPATGDILYPLQTATSRFIDDELIQKAVFGEVAWDVIR